MGNMITFWFIGFEKWGNLRPEKMWHKDGRCFKPLIWGIWYRSPKEDKNQK